MTVGVFYAKNYAYKLMAKVVLMTDIDLPSDKLFYISDYHNLNIEEKKKLVQYQYCNFDRSLIKHIALNENDASIKSILYEVLGHSVRGYQFIDCLEKTKYLVITKHTHLCHNLCYRIDYKMGMCELEILPDGIEINLLQTNNDYLNIGYAKILLETIVNIAAETGNKLALLVAPKAPHVDRDRLIAFYSRLGFVVCPVEHGRMVRN